MLSTQMDSLGYDDVPKEPTRGSTDKKMDYRVNVSMSVQQSSCPSSRMKVGDAVRCKRDEHGRKMFPGKVTLVYADGTLKIRFADHPTTADRKHVLPNDVVIESAERAGSTKEEPQTCRGTKADGAPCTLQAKEGGYCGRHAKQHESPETLVFAHTGPLDPSPLKVSRPSKKPSPAQSICKATKNDGTPCTVTAKEGGGFCGKHTKKAGGSGGSGGGAAAERPSPAQSICKATKNDGTPCTAPAKEGGGFCGKHTKKAGGSGGSGGGAAAEEPSPAQSICKATKNDGTPCTAPAKEGGFCGKHTKTPLEFSACPPLEPSPLKVPLVRQNTAKLREDPRTRLMPLQVKRTLRVVTWNLLHLSKKQADTKKAMRFIRRVIHEADFAALEEVDDECVVPAVVADLGPEWAYCQQRISDRGGAGSSEHYAFVWRRDAVECLIAPEDAQACTRCKNMHQQQGGKGYILKGHKDRAAVESFFHRPPMVSIFRVRNNGFVFAATVIHVTFDGRENDYAPVKIPARKLEAENLAALAYLMQVDHDLEIDRVIMFGDYNMPCRPENFESLLGPKLGYSPCLDPETCPTASMLSKSDGGDVGGADDADYFSVAIKGGKKKKRGPIPGDFLWDNIILSPPLRSTGGRGGAEVAASGVCDLVSLLDDFMNPDALMIKGVQMYADQAQAASAILKIKKALLKDAVSDHMPVFADLTTGSHYGRATGRADATRIEVVRLPDGSKLGREYVSVATHGKKEAQRRAKAFESDHSDLSGSKDGP